MNVPPDRTGRLCRHEVDAILSLRDRLGIEPDKPLPANGRFLDIKATATSTWEDENDAYSADKLCDGGMQTRWASSDMTPSVEFELEPGTSFDKITMFEYCDIEAIDNISNRRRNRIQAYNVECLSEGRWETIYVSDKPMGDCGVIRLSRPVKADRIRLNITSSVAPPSLYEFSVIDTSYNQ